MLSVHSVVLVKCILKKAREAMLQATWFANAVQSPLLENNTISYPSQLKDTWHSEM